jgi:FkbM family methyltransferase
MPLASPYGYDSTSKLLASRYNWIGLLRAWWVVTNPVKFFVGLATHRVPETLSVRTPTGTLRLTLRNFESLKTLFGIFCREDYATPNEPPFFFYDIGANIGFASLYFLSRNRTNRGRCFEPDPNNLACLRQNLEAFGDRVTIVEHAVTTESGECTFYLADTGKHSTLHPNNLAVTPHTVVATSLAEVLADVPPNQLAGVVKIDVEGLEEALVKSVRFEDYPRLRRLLCESTTCSQLVSRPHRCDLRNGYIEDMIFAG